MTEHLKKTERVKFRPKARVIHTLGADLIKDEMAGVIELVKNSYDARASKVVITFKNLADRESAELAIDDDGDGMSRRAIVNGWLSPATATKVVTPSVRKSGRRRPILGKKGVGRFSAMRLGDGFHLETTPRGEKRRYVIDIDWQSFLAQDKLLSAISFNLQTYSSTDPLPHGTKIKVTKLNDTWDERRVRRLLRELSHLVSPYRAEEDRFDIVVDLTASGLELQQKIVPVEPPNIPAAADYTVHADIRADGTYTLEWKRRLYSDSDAVELEEVLSGEDIRSLFPEPRNETEEEETLEKWGDPKDTPLPLPCGPLSLTFHIWDRDALVLKEKSESVPDFEGMAVRAIRRNLDKTSGVAIYRDGFRVRPYGESDRDWLELSPRRVNNPSVRLSPNQMYGVIEISRAKNPRLEDQASREGLKENDAFRTLYWCTMAVMNWAEPKRALFRQRHFAKDRRPTLSDLRTERDRLFTELTSLLDRPDSPIQRTQAMRLVSQARAVADSEHELISEQAAVMHDYHALGLLVQYILHDAGNLETALHSAANNLERRLQRNGDSWNLVEPLDARSLSVMGRAVESVRSVQVDLGSLLKTLDPLTHPARRKRPHTDVVDVVRRVARILKPELEEDEITLKVPDDEVRVLAWEADVFHAVFNVLKNAAYWATKGGNEKARIVVSCKERTQGGKIWLDLQIEDTGPGVKETDADAIFTLGFSRKPEGKGLGLFIAREAMLRSHGDITIVNPGKPGARFKLSMEVPP